MSIVRQQRCLSFAAGTAMTVAFYISFQREIWRSTAEVLHAIPGQELPKATQEVFDPMFGSHFRGYVARQWNGMVDAAFQPVIHAMSKRGL